eukprot:6469719-Pyramimonas_sp.AAC.1
MERVIVAKFEDESMETVRDENWNAHRQTQRSLKGRWTDKRARMIGKTILRRPREKSFQIPQPHRLEQRGRGRCLRTVRLPPGPVHEGDATEAVRVAVEDQDDPDLMVDAKIGPTPITNNEERATPNRRAESGKRRKNTDLFEKTKRWIRMKTPYGPSLRAVGTFFDDKASDWDQLDWSDFDP